MAAPLWGLTWLRLLPAGASQTAGGRAGKAHSPPSAPGSADGCRQWLGTDTFDRWRPQTLRWKIGEAEVGETCLLGPPTQALSDVGALESSPVLPRESPSH